MKKIKKIILVIIVALITFISVFSCVKGKYTPEPILNPVSVLKPANSVNDDVVSPTGTYDKFYFNTSLDVQQVLNIMDNVEYNIDFVQLGLVDFYYSKGYYIIIDGYPGQALWFNKFKETSDQQIFTYYIIYAENNSSERTFDYIFSFNDVYNDYQMNDGFQDNKSILEISITGASQVLGLNAGTQNNLLTNLISPVPFLFEGTSNNISWTSTGLDNPNNIQNIYFNTNLSNQAIKNILDTYVGTTSGIDIFNYTHGGVLVRCHVINNSANAFIQLIGGSTTLYKWIYNSVDTEESIWWYGIDPSIIDNDNVITSPQGNSLNGFNIYELRALFSSSNDFVEQTPGDSYEQGYQDGYTAGQTAGYNSGYTAGETAGQTAGYNQGYTEGETAGYNSGYTAGETAGQTAGYNNGYTAGQTAGYNQGYLDGLDDGADTNISFQYVESVLTLIGNFLNIEVLPGIKLSYALGIVIILTIISIIKMVVK